MPAFLAYYTPMRTRDGQFHGGSPIVLVPASLLPLKPVWMEIVHELGEHDLLLVLPTAREAGRRAFEQVGHTFNTAGYCVTTISVERVLAYCQTVLDGA